MKSVKLSFVLVLIYFIFSNFGCNCKDRELCVAGRVLYPVSCQSENGPGWLIEVQRASKDTILTTTLPDEFKVEGRRLFFNTTSPSGNTYCTANLTPRQELDIVNVSSIGCIGE